jgi:hypothetical protein
MTTAREHLAAFVAAAAQHAPSITLAQVQRNESPSGTGNWKPGIAGYGWGINGRVLADSSGARTALQFTAQMWFSDRRTNPSASPPAWQQFAASAHDSQRITLSPAGDNVTATIVLLSWGNATFSATSFGFEQSSRQLMFNVPGAGPNAPRALLAVSMHPTGSFGFL